MSLPDSELATNDTTVSLDSPLKLCFENLSGTEAFNPNASLNYDVKSPSLSDNIENDNAESNEIACNDDLSYSSFPEDYNPLNNQYFDDSELSASPNSVPSSCNSPVHSPIPNICNDEDSSNELLSRPLSNQSSCDSLPARVSPSNAVENELNSSNSCPLPYSLKDVMREETSSTYSFHQASSSKAKPPLFRSLPNSKLSSHNKRSSISLPSSPCSTSCHLTNLRNHSSVEHESHHDRIAESNLKELVLSQLKDDKYNDKEPFYSLSPKSERSSPFSLPSPTQPPSYYDHYDNSESFPMPSAGIETPCSSSRPNSENLFPSSPPRKKVKNTAKSIIPPPSYHDTCVNSENIHTSTTDVVRNHYYPSIPNSENSFPPTTSKKKGKKSSKSSATTENVVSSTCQSSGSLNPSPAAQTSSSNQTGKETNTCVVDLTDLTDDDDDVEIVSMDQPVVFLCEEKKNSKKRKLRSSAQSPVRPCSSEEPILIYDNDGPSTSGISAERVSDIGNQINNIAHSLDTPNVPLSSGESNRRNGLLMPPLNSYSMHSSDPQFFGELLNQSIVPLDRDGKALSESVSGGSEPSERLAAAASLITSPSLQNCVCSSASNATACPIHYCQPRLTESGARARSSTRSVVEEPIPQDILNDLSEICAEDSFVRQMMEMDKRTQPQRNQLYPTNVSSVQAQLRASLHDGTMASSSSTASSTSGIIPSSSSSLQEDHSLLDLPVQSTSNNNNQSASSSGRLFRFNSSLFRSIASYFTDSSSSSSSPSVVNSIPDLIPSGSSTVTQSAAGRTPFPVAGSCAPPYDIPDLSKAGSSSNSFKSNRPILFASEVFEVDMNGDIIGSGSGTGSGSVSGSSEDNNGFSCPICFESFQEIKKEGRTISSTVCGHIFCTDCLVSSFKQVKQCPTCRKRISKKQYHPLYL